MGDARPLLPVAGEARPLLLELPAHATVAFAAGYVLEAKSGLDVTIRQRTHRGIEDWSARTGSIPEGPFWCERPDRRRRPAGRDVALAVSVWHPAVEDVEAYLSSLEPAAYRPSLRLPVTS